MSTFDESTVRRDTAGRFDEKPQTAAEVELPSAPADENAELRDALFDRWGVHLDDIPGLEAAWAERYASLDAPEPGPGAADVANSVLGLNGDYESIAVRQTPRGFEAHVTDEDPDGYSYEAETVVYVIPAEHADRISAGIAADDERHRRTELARERTQYLDGSLPVWNLLADEDEVRAAREARDRTRRDVGNKMHRAAAAKEFEDRLNEVHQLVDAGELSAADRQRLWNVKLTGGGRESLRANEVHTAMLEAQQATARHETAQAMLVQANALPDGELKDFLVGTRPERTVPVTEGKGRSKRTVHKSYTPKSELQTEVQSAESSFQTRTERLTKVATQLGEMKKYHDGELAAHRERIAAADDAHVTLFHLGLPDGLSDIPMHPSAKHEEGEQW